MSVLKGCTLYSWILLFFALYACGPRNDKLFKPLLPNHSGIEFNNQINEDEYLNILSNEYIYNGAGVGIGDFNNDGLSDIFFCGSQVSNRLYLNQGNLQFSDISKESGIQGRTKWSTGVSIVDINDDGWSDIYVCVSNHTEAEGRRNQLFINQGLNESGIPEFSEQSRAYGVDDDGYSTHAAFFDYDNDGDLDLYILTNYLDTKTPNTYREKIVDGSSISNDRLYRNEGNGTFQDITFEAEIVYEGYGLGVSIFDLDMDGWKDIYISNDYLTNDLIYINNQDGTFHNRIEEYIKHQTHSAMGHDIADINNDGLVDILTLDMLPETNSGLKKMHGVSRFENELLNEKFGYQPQYKRNMLQLNNGNDAFGHHSFSEIGLFADVYATEWSWTALFADFDNDGNRDLFVTNGYPRDVTDLDYAVSGMGRGRGVSNEEQLMLIPVRKMSNYMFKNNGDLTFKNQTEAWGLNSPSFSNGAVYADLDDDGDLELIISNYNQDAAIYENRAIEINSESNNYISIELLGKDAQTFGARIYLYADSVMQFAENYTFRGYRSTVDSRIHFGLGSSTMIDSIVVYWHRGGRQKLEEIPTNQILSIQYDEETNSPIYKSRQLESSDYHFSPVNIKSIRYKHTEPRFDDFSIQETLHRQLSQSGPPLQIADLDDNGLEDLFIGGSAGQNQKVFFQNSGSFEEETLSLHPEKEDTDVLFFDADSDGDLDLYLVSGSLENGVNPVNYQDRLYINEGGGKFNYDSSALPEMLVSGTCVKASDYDGDGDLDLFVGGYFVPGQYPQKVDSYLLRNDSKGSTVQFTDVTDVICPELSEFGNVKDAIWTDMNNDGLEDLIVVGDWMGISIFSNEGDYFKSISQHTQLQEYKGWWNCVAAGDFDADGDMDLVAGNEGLNSWFKASQDEPIEAYSNDFNNDGRYDLLITSYGLTEDGKRVPYPVHFKSDLTKQMDKISTKFPSYASYSTAKISDILSDEELQRSDSAYVNWMASSYIENQGEGKFKISPLPNKAQFAPIHDFLVDDYNQDGNLDMILIGNDHGNSVFWGPMDAMNGLLMIGDGNGQFDVMNYNQSGFYVPGDAREIGKLQLANGQDLVVVSQNQDSLKLFQLNDVMASHAPR